MPSDLKMHLATLSEEDAKAYREKVSQERKLITELLWHEQDHKCFYCGIETIFAMFQRKQSPNPAYATLDHLICQAKGGKDTPDNVVMACNDCNFRRGDMKWEKYKRFMDYFLLTFRPTDYKLKQIHLRKFR